MATTPLGLLRGMRRREQAAARDADDNTVTAVSEATPPRPASLFGDVIGLVMRYLTIRDLLAVEIASRDAWLQTVHSHGGGAWKTLRDTQFDWANSTAQFLLDVSASKKRGVLGLLREVTREVGLGSPAWDVYRRRQAAMRRFVARPCECMVGAIGRCHRPGCGRDIAPDPLRCFHGPVPTEPDFDGRMRTYCSVECDVALHGTASSFAWSVPHLMRVLDRGSDMAIVHQFATAFGGFPRLVFLSLQQDLPRMRPRNLRRAVSLLVQHRPDVFPVRSWSLVGPQFVPMFDDLQGLEGSWSLQDTFRKRLRWCVGGVASSKGGAGARVRACALVRAHEGCRVCGRACTRLTRVSAEASPRFCCGRMRAHKISLPPRACAGPRYETIDELQKLTVAKARDLRPLVLDYCRVPAGVPTGTVTDSTKLRVHSVQYPAGVDSRCGRPRHLKRCHSSSPRSGSGSGSGRVGVFARPTLVLLSPNGPVMHKPTGPARVLLRSHSHKLRRRPATVGDEGGHGSGDTAAGSSDGGWGDRRGGNGGRRRPMSPLAARGVGRSGRLGGSGSSPLTALSVTPRSRAVLLRGDSGSSRGSWGASGAGSDVDSVGSTSVVDVTSSLGAGSGVDGAASAGNGDRARAGASGAGARRSRAPWSVSVTPLHHHGRSGSGGSVGSAGSGGNMLGGGPRRDTRVAPAAASQPPGDRHSAAPAHGAAREPPPGGNALRVSTTANGGSDGSEAGPRASPDTCESHVDSALVRFLDALIEHGGVACVTAWRWLKDAEGAGQGGGAGNGDGAGRGSAVLRGGILTAALVRAFNDNNGLALLCSAIDCPQPANTTQAAVVMGSLLRAVGCVRIAHGRMDVSLTGSPIVTVWCQRAGLAGASTAQPSARLSKVPAGMVPLSFSPRAARGHARANSTGASRHRRSVTRASSRTWEELEW